MKVGMKIIGVLDKEENQFYSGTALDVDEEELFDKFVLAYQQGLNLSVNAEIYNDASMELIVVKAQRDAKAISDATGSAEENVEGKAEEVAEEKKEETVEETKNEEAVVVETPAEEIKVEEPAPVGGAAVEEKKEGEGN